MTADILIQALVQRQVETNNALNALGPESQAAQAAVLAERRAVTAFVNEVLQQLDKLQKLTRELKGSV